MTNGAENETGRGQISFLQAVSMAVGTMIGASIFSVFGVGARIARQNLPEAFLLSGAMALIVGYSYAKLGPHIISNAGPIAFILRGIGDNVITGALSILMWLTYVVSVAMFSRGFAGYFLPLLGVPATPVRTATVVVAVAAFFTVLNFFGSKAVGKAELWIVFVKLAILGAFIAVGLLRVQPSRVAPSADPSQLSGLVHASVLFFLSYMGFGLITNVGENIREAEKTIPRAIYTSIGIAVVVYVSVSVVAIGNLPLPRLIQVGENALAVAAEPFLGHFGFVLISVGALFSISSALNATLYGGANIAYALAKDGELPEFFEHKVWFGSMEGLYITAALSIAFALLFDMNGIVSITSSVFTVIYIFVLVSHIRLSEEVGGNRFALLLNLLILVAVLLALLDYQYRESAATLAATVAVLVAALAVEAVYRLGRKRAFRLAKGIAAEIHTR